MMGGTLYAVLIGNDVFPNETRLATLKCPLNDVREMAAVLRSEKHGPYQVTTLENRSRDVIVQEIYRVLVVEARPEDRVLIFFAGHGRLSGNDGHLYLASENTQLHMLPATSVAVGEIYRYMRESVCRQLILILDCCYSGAVEKLFGNALQFRGDSSEQVTANLSAGGGAGSYILTASTGMQRAEEREDEGHGLLTKYILKGIREGEADRDDDGSVSMHELTRYVQEQVRAEGRQTPLNFTLHEDNGGIVIAATGKAARSRKLKDVQEKLFRFAMEQRVTLRTLRAVLSVLAPDPSLTQEQTLLCHNFVDRLYNRRSERMRFLETLEEASTLAVSLRTAESSAGMRALQSRCEEALASTNELQTKLSARELRIEELEQKCEATEAQLASAEAERAALSSRNEEMLLEKDALASERDKLGKELHTQTTRAEKDRTALADARQRCAKAETSLELVFQKAEQATERTTALSASLAELKRKEKELTSAAKAGEKELSTLKAAVEQEQLARKNAERALTEATAELAPFREAAQVRRGEESRAARRQAVLDILSKYFSSGDGLRSASQISENKLQTARLAAGVHKDIEVLAGIDNTVFGSMKDCILFTPERVYWPLSAEKSVFFDYGNLPAPHEIVKAGAHTLKIGEYRVQVIAAGFDPQKLTELLTQLRANALKGG